MVSKEEHKRRTYRVMRYFKKSGNDQKDIDRIAGEIINISFGRNYYINGQLNPRPDMKTNYNTFNIDSVDYEIHPNLGYVILLCSDALCLTMSAAIKQRTTDFERLLHSTHGFKKTTTGTAGTTQYLLMEDAGFSGMTNIGFITSSASPLLANVGVSWLITNELNNLLMPCELEDTSYKFDKNRMTYSLSAIVYDTYDSFQLADGYLSPDFPDICDTTARKMGNVIDTKITVSVYAGLYAEIAKLFGVVKKPVITSRHGVSGILRDLVTFGFTQFPEGRVLNWIKWEDVKPIENDVGVIESVDLIKRGLLNFDESLKDESDEVQLRKSKESGSKDYRCFITGVPIYEDAYVLDVYQQVLEEVIDVDDFDKYPDAEIIPMEIVDVPDVPIESKSTDDTKNVDANDTDDIEDGNSDVENEDGFVPNYVRRRREREKKLKESAKKKKEAAKKKNANLLKKKMKAEAQMIESVRLANELVKQRREAKANGKSDSKDDTSTNNSLKDILANGSAKKKMPPKRGQKKAVELIKIRRVVTYNTSRHLLVSPYYVHCTGILDVISLFEKNTGTKVLMFRTFAPRTLANVIDSIENISDAHRQFLHEFNTSATFDDRKKVKTANITLRDDFSTKDIIEAHTTGKICGVYNVSC